MARLREDSGNRFAFYNRSSRGKERRRKYRHDNSKWTPDAEYLARPIVAIDGEGYNTPSGDHYYALLAISGVEPLVALDRRLTTQEILDYLWENLSDGAINVIYGGSYDFNHWVRDLGRIKLDALYHSNFMGKGIAWGEYRLKWMRGKQFQIIRGDRVVTINDTVSFFQQPFVGACDLYLSENPVWQASRETIVREKLRRGVFRPDELENIGAYNQLELDVLEQLIGELRSRLNKVGIRPRRWNSPGAIAAALFLREGVKAHRSETVPEYAARAARFAYFGGRFEVLKYGITNSCAYEYDVNSAYPRALLELPSLRDASWQKMDGDGGSFPFALYHIRYSNAEPANLNLPGPVPVRGKNGTICYPMNADTWIWSPEMETLRAYCEKVSGAAYHVIETVVCTPSNSVKPFAFVAALYKMRQALKKAKDGAQLGIKLGLNSLYGKLAQQVGWIPATKDKPAKIPPYHQLEWAGYVTSHCRAAVLGAALEDLSSVIAFETDALFTTHPLTNLTIGTNLGDFELTEFTDLTYIQSGHYYANGNGVAKYRGVDRGFLTRSVVEESMVKDPNIMVEQGKKLYPGNTHPAKLTRFFTAGIALARRGGMELWCKWREEPKMLALEPAGKRRHGPCWCEADGPAGTVPLVAGAWHTTHCPVSRAVSSEYPVAWINPDPNMKELAELREAEVDWEA